MAILNSTAKAIKQLLWLCFFLYFSSCNYFKTDSYKYIFKKDSLTSAMSMEEVFAYDGCARGVHFFHFQNGSTNLCVLENQHEIALLSFDNPNQKKVVIEIEDSIDELVAYESSIYYFPTSGNCIKEIQILNDACTEFRTFKHELPPFFGDSVFIATRFASPIVPLSKGGLLIPYGVQYDSCVNMIDTFAYAMILKDSDANFKLTKVFDYPATYFNRYEYSIRPISNYDILTNTIYYTFQKIPALYSYNLNTKKRDSVDLGKYTSVDYAQDKVTNMTYWRKYLTLNDYNKKIYCDDSSRVYLIKENSADNKYKFEIHCYDKNLKEIAMTKLKDNLDTDISFIKKNKLYVYISGSDNKFVTFSITDKL